MKQGNFHQIAERLFFLRRNSIQRQLLSTYIVVNLLPLIIVGIISYIVSSNAISAEVKGNNTQLVEEIGRSINAYLKDLNRISNTYVSKVMYKSINSMDSLNRSLDLNDVEVLENLMQMNEYINTTFSSSNDFLSIRLFSNRGEFLSTAFDDKKYKLYRYNSPEDIRWREKMQDYKSDALIFDVHPLDENGEFSFVACRAAINPYTGKRYGYISYDKDFAFFSDIFKQFERRGGSQVQVINENNKLLYHTNQALIGSQADEGLLSLIGEQGAGTLVKDIDRKKMIITFTRHTSGNLTVVGTVPYNILLTHVNPLRNITVVICLISLFLVVILSLFISYYIAKPIKRLSKLMTQVELGNFNVNVGELSGNDEIYNLSRSFNSMINTIRQLIRSRYEVELHKKDAELKALLMQINPHFLYNTLEVISGIADAEGVEKISEITQSLSKMLRYNIDLKSEKVTIGDELNNCNNFFLILKSRFEDNLIIETDIDKNAEKYTVVKLIMQPLIENAIKHGIEKKLGKGVIKLTVRKIEEIILIELEDNGIGFDEEKLSSFKKYMEQLSASFFDSTATKSLGLKNVYARLRIFFGEKLVFKIVTQPGDGTVIRIEFPAIEI